MGFLLCDKPKSEERTRKKGTLSIFKSDHNMCLYNHTFRVVELVFRFSAYSNKIILVVYMVEEHPSGRDLDTRITQKTVGLASKGKYVRGS